MKRRVAKLGLLILAGAIVNVAVAWGLGTVLPPKYRITRERDRDLFDWRNALAARHQVSTYGPWSGGNSALAQRVDVSGVIRAPSRQHHIHLQAQKAGWPIWTLYGEEVVLDGKVTMPDQTRSHGSFRMGSLMVENGKPIPPFLPAIPLWPGFAINTIFYAAILWLLFAAPGRVRRWRRIKRGLCPACAYPVGESATCTECGHPVKR